jgi:hypothetical protein
LGLASLNVWIHDQEDPCKISDQGWWVAVTYCNGNPVEWCGHTYSFEEAKCGHAEFRLPPGCYIVHGFQFFVLKKLLLLNFTEHAIVIVNCDELGCVHLFSLTSRQRINGAARAEGQGGSFRGCERCPPKGHAGDWRLRCAREASATLNGISTKASP